jgi:outer membrane receptor protein involved in Fe transport
MKKKIFFPISLGCMMAIMQSGLWAQQRVVTGSVQATIIDAQSLQPLPGATMQQLGSSAGALADAQGIAVLDDLQLGTQTVIVNYLGYQADTLKVDVRAAKSQALAVYLKESRLEIKGLEIEAGRPLGLSLINRIDLQTRPVNSSQELLRAVPGIFIAQHAGGGKAEQIFLRGFDIDHGTDLALSADGMPVNMVSHAHGQGYADLHFLIPETIERLSIDKGPYAARNGNLATAGAIDFQTRNNLDQNVVKVEGGMYNNYRALAMLKLDRPRSTSKQANAWIAGEYTFFKGYFEAPQNLHRINVFAKYRKMVSRHSLLTASASTFRSQWNASGQIPTRAVEQGLISRWGSIDSTEGGQTQRSNVNLQLVSNLNQGWTLRQQLYGSAYAFNLYSNFTFFANDSIDGDQIRQRERRMLYGYQSTLGKTTTLLKKTFYQETGLGIRLDDVGSIGLYHTQQRAMLGNVQDGAVNERNAFAWVHGLWSLNSHLQLGGTLRADYLHFAYDDHLEASVGKTQAQKAILNPKVTLDYFVNDHLQFFIKAGSGFHSNDTRVVLGPDQRQILPRALGSDLGAMCKPTANLLLQVAVWGLAMQQEFVYVGDAGVVEPSGRSRRVGVDLSARCQLRQWLSVDADLNLAHARGSGATSYIPLAPWLTSTGGLTAESPRGLRASLRYRLLGNRAADEAWTLTAQGYCLLDGAMSYTLKSRYTIGLSGQNLLNMKWKEAQFSTTTRLRGEAAPITEIHYTPGTPFALKLSLACNF